MFWMFDVCFVEGGKGPSPVVCIYNATSHLQSVSMQNGKLKIVITVGTFMVVSMFQNIHNLSFIKKNWKS